MSDGADDMGLPQTGRRGVPAPRPAGAIPALRCEPLGNRAGVKIAGELDFTVRDDWESILESVTAGSSDVHLDLSEVEFSDTAAAVALVRTAHRVGPGRRLVVDRPPAMLLNLLDLLWPEGVPTIEVRAR